MGSVAAWLPGGGLAVGNKKKKEEAQKSRATERAEIVRSQELAAANAAATEKERLEVENAAIAEEKRRKKYGRRGFPMETYLGEDQAGVRKSLLGG